MDARKGSVVVADNVGPAFGAHAYLGYVRGCGRYDSRNDRWLPVTDDPLLRERSLPAGLVDELVASTRRLRPWPDSPASRGVVYELAESVRAGHRA